MRKLLVYLKPFTVHGIAIVVLVFLQSISDLLLPTLMADIVNIGIARGDTPYILKTGGLMILAAAVGIMCVVAVGYLTAIISSGFGKILRERVFSQVTNYSLQEFDSIGTASLITRTTNDINQLQHVVMMVRMVISAPMMLVGGVIMAVNKDPSLSVIIVLAIPSSPPVSVLSHAGECPFSKPCRLNSTN